MSYQHDHGSDVEAPQSPVPGSQPPNLTPQPDPPDPPDPPNPIPNLNNQPDPPNPNPKPKRVRTPPLTHRKVVDKLCEQKIFPSIAGKEYEVLVQKIILSHLRLDEDKISDAQVNELHALSHTFSSTLRIYWNKVKTARRKNLEKKHSDWLDKKFLFVQLKPRKTRKNKSNKKKKPTGESRLSHLATKLRRHANEDAVVLKAARQIILDRTGSLNCAIFDELCVDAESGKKIRDLRERPVPTKVTPEDGLGYFCEHKYTMRKWDDMIEFLREHNVNIFPTYKTLQVRFFHKYIE